MNNTTRALLLGALGTLPLAACTSADLNQTSLDTPCASGTCSDAEANGIRPLAVGARMPLEVSPAKSEGGQIPATHLRIVDDRVLVEDQGRLLAVGAGVSAVLFVTDDDRVLDLTHVATAEAARLAFMLDPASEAAGPVVLAPGASVTLRVIAKSDSQALGGDLAELYAVDDAAFTLLPEPGAVTIVAPATDVRTRGIVTVTALGLSSSIDVEVRP